MSINTRYITEEVLSKAITGLKTTSGKYNSSLAYYIPYGNSASFTVDTSNSNQTIRVWIKLVSDSITSDLPICKLSSGTLSTELLYYPYQDTFKYNGIQYGRQAQLYGNYDWHFATISTNGQVVNTFWDGAKVGSMSGNFVSSENCTLLMYNNSYADTLDTVYMYNFMITSGEYVETSDVVPALYKSAYYNVYVADGWGGVYSVVSGTFQKVADDWTALTDAQKIALFKATNYETAMPEQLATLGKFRIVTYAEDNTQPSCKVTALPKDQIVLPKELISTKAFENVDSITPTVTNNTTTAKVRFFLTNDLKTYYVYDSTTKAFDVIDATSSDTLLTSGMNVSDFTGIDTTALNTFISKNVGIGIGFVLSSTTISDLTTVDNLAMQVDMKGSWNHATYGTDVTYGYTNNDVLTVTLVTANSFKINYQE